MSEWWWLCILGTRYNWGQLTGQQTYRHRWRWIPWCHHSNQWRVSVTFDQHCLRIIYCPYNWNLHLQLSTLSWSILSGYVLFSQFYTHRTVHLSPNDWSASSDTSLTIRCWLTIQLHVIIILICQTLTNEFPVMSIHLYHATYIVASDCRRVYH